MERGERQAILTQKQMIMKMRADLRKREGALAIHIRISPRRCCISSERCYTVFSKSLTDFYLLSNQKCALAQEVLKILKAL